MIILKHSSAPLAFARAGYTVLVMVIVVGAFAVAIAAFSLLFATTSTQNSRAIEESALAGVVADACAEEALQTLNDNLSFTGTQTRTIGTTPCTFTVAVGAGAERTITAWATVQTTTRKVKIITSQLQPKIILGSWQEVGDF